MFQTGKDSKADYLINIPTNYNFSSINLSHSVILFSSYLFNIFTKNKNSFKSSYKSKLATKGEVKKMTSFLVNNLDNCSFLQPKHKRKASNKRSGRRVWVSRA